MRRFLALLGDDDADRARLLHISLASAASFIRCPLVGTVAYTVCQAARQIQVLACPGKAGLVLPSLRPATSSHSLPSRVRAVAAT